MQGIIAAVILAGGKGRRMGGRDKAMLELAGKPLLAHVLARLRPQVGRIILSSNAPPAALAAFGLPVAADRTFGAGPLAGIAAGAQHCRERWPEATHLLTVPVDVPLVPDDLARSLARAADERIAVAQAGGRVHWTVALWPMQAAAALAADVAEGGLRRVEDAITRQPHTFVSFSDAAPFLNANTPQDLDTILRALGEN